jgi:transposase
MPSVPVSLPPGSSSQLSAAVRTSVLEAENAHLKNELAVREARLLERESRIRLLEEALRVMKADRWGASREKLLDVPGQSVLFNEAEVSVELAEVLGSEVALTATPLRENKPASVTKAGRRALASHLPRRIIRHELEPSALVCACGSTLTEIGTEVSEQLDYVPAKVEVLQHVRVKYACPGCERCVKTAPPVPQVLPKTNAAPGLLAQIVTAEYVDSLPLHRQEAIFARHGVDLPRATQAAWVIGLIAPLTPLLNLLDERLRESGYIRMDETPVQVLKSDKAPSSEHWMWVRVAGPPRQRIILFDYHANRSGVAAQSLLEGARGVLQTDGYGVYDTLAARLGLTHCGCLAHARRRFFEAFKALPKDVLKSSTAAHEAVRRIDALYAIEREIKTASDEDRLKIRREREMPLLEALHAWAEQQAAHTLPSGKLGEAFAYLLTQWPKLIRYINEPCVAIDTNLAENAIRPFAIGRNNWIFADTVNGAKASAALYSLISTARANALEPYAYLMNLFEKLPHARTVGDFEDLLPFNPAVGV